jgi:hypothetical protein
MGLARGTFRRAFTELPCGTPDALSGRMSLHVPATRSPRVSILVFTVTMALAQLGCMATVSYSHPVAPTRLVAVSPGVWVVYDYPEAIFYSDNAYWWWNGGAWYTSRYADDGWVVVNVVSVPAPLRQVQRPQTYVHYRVEAQSRPVPRAHVRRTYVVQPAPQRAHDNGRGRGQAAPPPRRDDGRGRTPPPRAEPHDDGRGQGGPTHQPGSDARGRGGDRDDHDDRGRGRSDDHDDRGRGRSDDDRGRGR